VELDGSVSDPIIDAAGYERVGLQLRTTVDRREFGLDWNMQLPNGEPALAYDVELIAELYLVRK
jgi:polyisoprenoid-binding protein YceI